MYKAVAKKKGTEDEFVPVTWGGSQFMASKEQLEQLVSIMRQNFPDIEYKVEEAT